MASYVFNGAYVAKFTLNTTSNLGFKGQVMDGFGNAWISPWAITGGNNIFVRDQTGASVAAPVLGSMMDGVCTFILANQAPATSWIAAATDFAYTGSGIATFVFGGVTYHVGTAMIHQIPGLGPDFWYQVVAVWTSDAAGALTLEGAVWSNPSLQNASYGTLVRKIDLCGLKTIDDDIFIATSLNDGTGAPAFWRFPPISEIIGGTCSGLNQCRLDFGSPFYSPGNTYYGLGMNYTLGTNAAQDQSCFVMPNAAGGTDLYVYVNKSTMHATSIVYLTASVQPTYPEGVMLKGTLPVVAYPAYTTGTPTTTNALLTSFGPDPGCFVDTAGAPYDAFTDVWQYTDGSAANHSQDYYPVPRIISSDGAGNLVVGWYQPYFQNNTYLGSSWMIEEKLRIQNYSAATGLFTDATLLAGPTVNITQLGSAFTGGQNFVDICGWELFLQGGSLYIWHSNGASATGSAQYVTWLGQIGSTLRRVMVWSNIGPPQLLPRRAAPASRDTPQAFSFTPVTDAPLSTDFESNEITVAGINVTVPVSVAGGEYSKNGALPTSLDGTAVNGDLFTALTTSSPNYSTSVAATLTIGGVSANFNVTTQAASPPPPPPPGTMQFGEFSRQGFEGYAGTGEPPGTTIVSGSAAGYFMTDDVGNWVPCNANAFTWGNAWTPPGVMGTDRTVIGTSSTGNDYTFEIQAFACGAVQRVGRATNPDTATPSGNNAPDECCQYFARGSGQRWVPVGVTIYLRDGYFNPAGTASYRIRPYATSLYATSGGSGSGKITIRSRTVDTSDDANGYPIRKHGSGYGAFLMNPQGIGGVSPLEFVDMWFPLAGTYGLPFNVAATNLTATRFSNCRFSGLSGYCKAIGNAYSGTILEDSTFEHTHTCFTTATACDGPVVTGNVVFDLQDGDFTQWAPNTVNITLEDNVGFNAGPGPLGVHCDFSQHLGITNGKTQPFASCKRNIVYDWDGQAYFFAGTTGANGFTAGEFDNNLACVTNPYHMAILGCDDAEVSFNTLLADPRAPAGSALMQVSGATGATLTKNISNRYSISNAAPVVKTPTTQVTIPTITAAGYIAAGFTQFVAPANATDYSLAALKSYFTPTLAAYNGALAQSGALDPNGNWNA